MLALLKKVFKFFILWQFCNFLLICSLFIVLFLCGAYLPKNLHSSQTTKIVSKGNGHSESYILEIPIKGIIFRNNTEQFLKEPKGAFERFKDDLNQASSDPLVKAIILKVNSPGGSVSACDELYYLLKEFKSKNQIPIYAHYQGVSASGGVYCSVLSDFIMAEPTCMTGSIGVLMESMNIENLFSKLGVQSKNFKSGSHKDMGSMFREDSKEEEQLFKNMVDNLFNRFVDIIIEGRKEKVIRDDIIDLQGSVFLAKKAKNTGLIDQIGFLPQLYKKIRSDLEADLDIVHYPTPIHWNEFVNILGKYSTFSPSQYFPSFFVKGPLYLLKL